MRDWVKNRRGQPEKLKNTGQTYIMIEKCETLDMLEWAIERARAALAQPSPKCATCNDSGQIVVSGPHYQGEFQPPEYETEPCDMCAQPSPAQAEAERLREAYEWGYGDGQNNPNGYSDKKERDACVNELLKQPSTVQADAERPTYECTMGVGGGDGNLFVHGDHASIKAAQKIVLERDAALARVAELEGKLTDWVHEGFRLNEALAVAQVQHSVPDDDMILQIFADNAEHSEQGGEHGYCIVREQHALAIARKLLATAPVCRLSRSALTDAQMRRLYDSSTETENERLGFAAFARLIRRAEAVHQIAAAPGKEVGHE
ncbi:hypothetical protein [Pseudomonas aeruginosa]|uniref:hypothetical protein n=1 Tax=Pseudomonas aeruginosa TaxID=287 RepID=UPI003FD64170